MFLVKNRITSQTEILVYQILVPIQDKYTI